MNHNVTTQPDKLLDASEAAAILNVPVTMARRLGREGKIPTVQLGRYVRFRRGDLDHFIAEGGTRAA